MRQFAIVCVTCAVVSVSGLVSAQTDAILTVKPDGLKLPEVGHVRFGYPACGPTGTSYFVTTPNPSISSDTQLVSVDPAGTTIIYDFSSMQGVKSATTVSIAPDKSGATVLVDGIAEKGSKLVAEGDDARQFLVRYDQTGHLRSVRAISSKVTISKIATLGSHNLLLLGVDNESGQVILRRADENGATVGEIKIPGGLLSEGEVAQVISKRDDAEILKGMKAAYQVELALSKVEMSTIGETVYLVKSGPFHEVVRVNTEGVVNRLPISPPPGVDPRSPFADQSSGLSLLSFGPGERDAEILKFDPKSGAKTGEIRVVGVTAASVICKGSGKFYVTRIDGSGETLLEATLASQAD